MWEACHVFEDRWGASVEDELEDDVYWSSLFAIHLVQIKLDLHIAVSDPVVSHVEGFWSFQAHLGSQYVVGSGIVGFNRCA
jgi:hypothetical protein